MSALPSVASEERPHPYDLRALAGLAAHGLTGLVDPDRQGLPYFLGEWRTRPPHATHNLWDYGDGSGRLMDALTLCTTLREPDETTAHTRDLIEAWVLRQLGHKGLSWVPVEPWVEPWGASALLSDPNTIESVSEISWSQRGTLMGLSSRYLQTGDETYLTHAKKLVDGLLDIAMRHPDGLYFPEGYYRKSGWGFEEHNLHPIMVEYNAAALPPIVRLLEISGYEPAYELALGLAEFALRHTEGYGPDGELLVPPGDIGTHFHTRSNFVLGVLKFGLVAKRPGLVSWAQSSYDQLCRHGTDFGWFPEGMGMRHGELCCTTDMIELALVLARHVDPRYFADAERYGRNHLLESQWRSVDDLLRAARALPPLQTAEPLPEWTTSSDVARRQYGAFSARPAMNDGFHLDATAMMQCCNGAGARALYDLWRYASDTKVTGAQRHTSVDLRFSVETPAVRVVSHEPTQGILEVTALLGGNVAVRLPEGTPRATLSRPGHYEEVLTADHGYVSFTARPVERVALRYDQMDRTAHYSVGSAGREDELDGHWRGETLLSVDPAGSYYPFYSRPDGLLPVTPSPLAQAAIDSI